MELEGYDYHVQETLDGLPVESVEEVGHRTLKITMSRPLTPGEMYLFARMGHDIPETVFSCQVEFTLWWD